MVIICVSFPVNLYTFQRFFPVSPAPFSWTEVHADWNVIQLYPSNGMVKPEMWGSIVGGWLIFIFFGTGAEAKKMYRGWLVALGAGKIWPSLLEEPMRTGNNGSSDKWKLFAGKAKSMFSKRSSDGTLVSTASFDGTALNSPTKSYASTKMLVPRRFSGESEIDTKPKSSWIVRAKKLFTGRNDLDEGMVGEPVPLSDVLVVKKEIEE